jgi:hypothetical protein
MTDEQAARIAALHVATLRRWLQPHEWQAMLRDNAAEARADVCHSHDYCDANESMAAAFADVMGRDIEADAEADARLWSRAWSLAMPELTGR